MSDRNDYKATTIQFVDSSKLVTFSREQLQQQVLLMTAQLQFLQEHIKNLEKLIKDFSDELIK